MVTGHPVKWIWNYRVSLVGLDQDEYVVNSDCEDEEGDDLEDDECRLGPDSIEKF